MFHEYEEGDWRQAHASGVSDLWRRSVLFIHTFTSIGSRLMASAFFKAGLYYYFSQSQVKFALVLVASLLLEMAARTGLFYLARVFKYVCLGHEIPSGCYVSMNYAWRETILSFGFQSTNCLVQAWFYLENAASYSFWIYAVVFGPCSEFPEELGWVTWMVLTPSSALFCSLTAASLLMLVLLRCMKLLVIRTPFPKTDEETNEDEDEFSNFPVHVGN